MRPDGGPTGRNRRIRNLSGVIINGCIRDSAELAKMDLGVLALAAMPLKK